MTITGTQNIILELLTKQDLISINEIKLAVSNQSNLKGKNNEDLLLKLIRLSLLELEKLGFVKFLDEQFLVLTRPLNNYPQTIAINGITAFSIAEVLNNAAALFTGNKGEELCNPLQITTQDIETLVAIANEINKDQEENGKFDEFHLPKPLDN